MYLYLKFPECPYLIERKAFAQTLPSPNLKFSPHSTSLSVIGHPEGEQGPPRLYEVLAPAMKGIFETKSLFPIKCEKESIKPPVPPYRCLTIQGTHSSAEYKQRRWACIAISQKTFPSKLDSSIMDLNTVEVLGLWNYGKRIIESRNRTRRQYINSGDILDATEGREPRIPSPV